MMKIKSKLFLKSFFLSLAAFAAVAGIIITHAYMNKLSVDPQGKESVVLLGVADGDSLISLTLVNIDPVGNAVSFCKIEDNMFISTGVVLQNMYSFGNAGGMISTLSKIVGARIDRYIVFSPSSVGNLTDILGGVNYLIPYKFEYDGKSYSGNNVMSGELACAMLSYENYSKEVSVSEIGCSYLKSFAVKYSELGKTAEFSEAVVTLNNQGAIDTNMKNSEIYEYCAVLAKYSQFAHRNVSIEGYNDQTSSNVFFIPNTLNSPYNIFK